jgi:metal-responsive CopG/Arc/MetJ family transcriptional regulator
MGYYGAVGRTQTLVQLSDELLALLDQHASNERRSRSDLIREAVERYLAGTRDAEIDRMIVDGYRATPVEPFAGEASARAMIEAEPW